eukprot:2898460-Pleurochrysis_carterae.AAC.1
MIPPARCMFYIDYCAAKCVTTRGAARRRPAGRRVVRRPPKAAFAYLSPSETSFRPTTGHQQNKVVHSQMPTKVSGAQSKMSLAC